MRPLGEAFRERTRLWVPALAFLVLNLVFLGTYQLVFAGRVSAVQQRLEASQLELAHIEKQEAELRKAQSDAKRTEQEVDDFYSKRLGTESERLTKIIAEVKGLAKRAGLEPTAISYPEQAFEDYGLAKRSIVFGVRGTYDDLRQLVNLLELSNSFLILEEVSLSESGGMARQGDQLQINLRISTWFAEGPAPHHPLKHAGGNA